MHTKQAENEDSCSNRSTRSHSSQAPQEDAANWNSLVPLPGMSSAVLTKTASHDHISYTSTSNQYIDLFQDQTIYVLHEFSTCPDDMLHIPRNWISKSSMGKVQESKYQGIFKGSMMGNKRRIVPILVKSAPEFSSRKPKKESYHVSFKLPKSNNMNRLRLLNEDANIIGRWNRMMIIPLSYEIWAFPFRLGFCSPGFNADNWILFTDIACDFCFLADACLNLITTIPAGTYPNQEENIDTIQGVAKFYLRYKFPQLFLSLTTYYVSVAPLVALV
eukprot:750499-Hanusia_phi.AAC.9